MNDTSLKILIRGFVISIECAFLRLHGPGVPRSIGLRCSISQDSTLLMAHLVMSIRSDACCLE